MAKINKNIFKKEINSIKQLCIKKKKISSKKYLTEFDLLKKEYAKSKSEIKKTHNKKNLLKLNLEFKQNSKNLKLNNKKNLKSLNQKSKEEILIKKIELEEKQSAVVVEKKTSFQSDLLDEKIKNNNNKKKKIKYEKDIKGAIKNFPLRMFKEIKRIRWGKNDLFITKKFFLVLLVIILVALFIWGAESAIVEILKLLKISKV